MANKIETSSKNVKPKINLNHNIYSTHYMYTYMYFIMSLNNNEVDLRILNVNFNRSQRPVLVQDQNNSIH